MSFKDRLKEARLAKGLKQTELSLKIGLSKNAVSNYEAGNSFPNIDTLYKIFETLDVDPNFLFQDDVKFHNVTLSLYEKKLVDKYRKLNTIGQQKTDTYIDDLLDNPRCTISKEEPTKDLSDAMDELTHRTARLAAFGGGTKIIPKIDEDDLDKLK